MILPEIYINKITLQNNVFAQTKDNPHIRDDISFTANTNVFGSTKFKQALANMANFVSTASESLSAHVELSIKDLTRDKVLFSDSMFRKYVKIGLVSITDDKSLSIILTSNRRETIDRLASEKKGVRQKIFGIDTAGSVENTYFFRHQFDFSREKKNLVIMAYVFVDVDRLEQDYNADLFTNLNEFKFVAENVIDDGEVPNTSYIFTDVDDRIYSGPVRYNLRSQEFTKFNSAEVLQQVSVPNATVCDMRKIKKLSQYSLDYSLQEELLESSLNKNLNKLTQELRQSSKFNQAYFSNLYVTRDESNAARGFFAVNYNEIVRTKANFGYILNRDSFDERKQQILESTRIKELKVYRRRVKKVETVDALGNPVTKFRDFSRDQIPTLVAYVTEKSYNSTTPTNNSKGGIREVFPDLGSDYRLFSFKDDSISSVTDGQYQYYIEISVEDNTTKFIEQQLKILRDAHRALDMYKTAADDPRFYGSGTNFSPQFLELLRNSTIYKKDGEDLWTYIMSRFLEASNNLYKDFDNSVFNTMLDMLRPESANQETLQLVSDIMLSYISRLERHIVRVTSEDAQPHPKPTGTYKSRNLDDISLVNHFSVVFDANTLKNTGLDFLSYFENDGSKVKFEDNGQGLISLTSTQYDERTKKEAGKYFKDISGNIKIGTDRTQYLDSPIDSERFSSLAPSIVKAGGTMVNMLDGVANWSPQKATEIETNITRVMTGTRKTAPKNDVYLASLSKFSVSTIEGDTDIGIDSNSLFGSGSNLNNSFDESQDPKSSFEPSLKNLSLKSKDMKLSTSKKPISKALNIKSSENIVDSSGITKLKNMPMQLKSVLSYTSLSDNVLPNTILGDGNISDIDLSNNFIFKFNYAILNKVEYLEGFDGNTRLPIWRPLTKRVLETKTSEIICRLKRYEDSEVDMDQMPDIPQYNEYFIIRVLAGSVENTAPTPELSFRQNIRQSIESIDTDFSFATPSLLNNGVFTI